MEATKDLKASPYNPQFWWKRADRLVKLGYPELGAVDAYKGLIWTKAAFDYRSPLGEAVRVSWGMYLFVSNSDKVSDHTHSGDFVSLLADGRCRTCLTTGLRVGRTGNGRTELQNTLLRVERICRSLPKGH